MKKTILFFCVIIMYINLAACGKKEKEITIDTYSRSNRFWTWGNEIVENENGYYILSGMRHTDKFITYLDKATNEATILCSKINCNHSFEEVPRDCDAYVGNVLLGSLNYYNGYIYYIGYNTGTYGCVLYRISESGSEHEKVCELNSVPDNSNSYYSYVITDKYVIYSESITMMDKKNTAYLKLYDFKDKSVETLYSYEEINAEIYDVRVTKDFIFFMQNGSKLYAFNVKDRSVDLIADSVCSYSLKDEKKLVYWKSYDGIYEKDIENKTEIKLYSSDDDTMMGSLTVVGDTCFVFNVGNLSYKEDTDYFIGVLKDNEIVSRRYCKRDKYFLPLYVGSDRVFTRLFGEDGSYIGYSLNGDKSIDADIINSGIKSQ